MSTDPRDNSWEVPKTNQQSPVCHRTRQSQGWVHGRSNKIRVASALTLDVARLMAAEVWDPPRCPPMHECAKEMWCRLTTQCHSAVEKNESLTFATMWLDVPRDIAGHRKTNTAHFHSHVKAEPKLDSSQGLALWWSS